MAILVKAEDVVALALVATLLLGIARDILTVAGLSAALLRSNEVGSRKEVEDVQSL